jgi:acyl-CoA thioesterase FadM
MEFDQNVVAGDELFSRAEVKIGCIDAQTLRPTAMPPDIYTELKNGR